MLTFKEFLAERERLREELDEDVTRRGFLGGLMGMMAGVALPTSAEAKPKGLNLPTKFKPLSSNPKLELSLIKAAKDNGITEVELAQFLAQIKHETWDFESLRERPQGPNYFEKKYGIKNAPQTAKILGNTKVGDGRRFYGRGLIQLTGRDNYMRAGKAIGVDLLKNPDLAAKPDVAIKVALWYWNTRVKPKVNNFMDTVAVTKTINPALQGLKDRHENFMDYLKAFAGTVL